MKIYRSTEYIEPKDEKVGMLQLEVISMWDWTSPKICYGTIYKGEPNEKNITFALKRCTQVVEPRWTKWETLKPQDITGEIIKTLKDMGMVVSDQVEPKKEVSGLEGATNE